jgi:peptide/nickel transport system permease protein
VIAVSSASLVLTRLAPGDYVTQSLGIDARPETIEQARARYGLNKSIGRQYRDWVVSAAHFDFGRSLLFDRPVIDLIPERAANTAILSVTALVAATLLGLPLGIITGSRRGGVLPAAIRSGSLVSLDAAAPHVAVPGVRRRPGWFPIGGMI